MSSKHPLTVWREAQAVPAENGGTRPMRMIDAAALYTIPVNTWWGWERWPGEPGFRRPDAANMQRLGEITGGAVRPEHYYRAALAFATLGDGPDEAPPARAAGG